LPSFGHWRLASFHRGAFFIDGRELCPHLLTFEADVFEVSGIPQGIKIALQGSEVIHVAGVGKHPPSNRLRRDATVPVDYDFRDHLLLPPARRAQQNEKQAQERPSRFTNLYN
jgi:hypothetical protein